MRYLFAIILLGLAGGGSMVFGQAKAGDLRFGPYTFQPTSGEPVQAEMGHLKVPENRYRRNSRLIELSFVRFKNTSTNAGPPIVYLAGGPGSSGIAAARGPRFPLFMAMREVGDVIVLDQRGTGISEPNMACTEPLDFPIEKPPTRAAVAELIRQRSAQCAARLKNQGVDLTGYNTNESADDLEDLRRALCAPKISLWAISYGTHLALTTLKRHESSISRAILAGIEGPEHTVKLPSNIQKHLEHIDRLVKNDPELSKTIPSFVGLVREVLDRVERDPPVVETTDPVSKQRIKVTLTKFVLQFLTSTLFGSAENALPRLYYQASKGDFSQAAARWAGFIGPRPSIGSAMSFMMDCYSGVPPARAKQIASEAKSTLLGDIMDFPIPDVCGAWTGSIGPSFWAPVRTKVPTLFISGTFDVRTPTTNAEEVRKGFANSEHLIIEGAVHSDPLFLSSPKIKDVMLEFMSGKNVSTHLITLPPLRFMQIPGAGGEAPTQ